MIDTTDTNSTPSSDELAPRQPKRRIIGPGLAVTVAAGLALGGAWLSLGRSHASPSAPPPPPAPLVTVSTPLRQDIGQWAGFLGQFAAVDRVELRPQVGGTLTEIDFQDGQIVQKGALLFLIDPRPYAIKAAEQESDIQSAQAKLAFSKSELWRAQQLKQTNFGTGENLDQRNSEQLAAEAALAQAQAQLADFRA